MSSCLVCGEAARGACATCREANYCSREHQNVHWIEGGHRYACYNHKEDPLLELEMDLEEPHPLVARCIDGVQQRLGEQILRNNDEQGAREWLRHNHIEVFQQQNVEGFFADAKEAVKKGWAHYKKKRNQRKGKGRKSKYDDDDDDDE